MLNTLLRYFNNSITFLLVLSIVYITYVYSFTFIGTNQQVIFLVINNSGIDVMSVFVLLFTILTTIPCYFIFKKFTLVKSNHTTVIFTLISILIVLLVNSDNIILFFFYYESLLLLSVLLVWLSSPNRRSKQTALYFLFWTQSGSFLVFLGVIILYSYLNILYFSNTLITSTPNCFILKLTSFFIFIGFAVKIPLWPFHFWLTKTHVEANTGFSIFLSGILVKTALLGLFKFKFIFIYINNYFLFFIIAYGIIDVSFKLYSQVDLKKLIAYATVQEMGLLVLLISFDSQYTRLLLIYFCFFHTTISGLFFLINDIVYKRFGSRHMTNLSGICSTHPKIFTTVMVSLFIFLGFPFTIKFYIELQILYKLIYSNMYYGLLFLFIVQYLSIIFFFKNIILILFGPLNNTLSVDLTVTELVYVLFFYTLILVLSIY